VQEVTAARVTIEFSPLSTEWARVGEFQANLQPRSNLRLLSSLQSREDYIRFNRLKRDPTFVSVELAGVASSARDGLILQFQPMLKCLSGQRKEDYIGFIDSVPVPSAKSVIGGLPEKSVRIDKEFDMPHQVVFGPAKLVSEYAKAVTKNSPGIDLLKRAFGSAIAVAFKSMAEARELEMPDWHVTSP
jgi:hypothetical protein